MTKKQCDKCGKLFKPEENNSGVVIIYTYESVGLSRPRTIEYDFCWVCLRDIKRAILNNILGG